MKIIVNQFKDHNARAPRKTVTVGEKSISCFFFRIPMLKLSLFSNFVIINPSIYSSLEEILHLFQSWVFLKSVNGVYLDVIGKRQVFTLSDHAITMVFRAALSAQLRRE